MKKSSIYIKETPILGLMGPKKNAALYNGFITPFMKWMVQHGTKI